MVLCAEHLNTAHNGSPAGTPHVGRGTDNNCLTGAMASDEVGQLYLTHPGVAGAPCCVRIPARPARPTTEANRILRAEPSRPEHRGRGRQAPHRFRQSGSVDRRWPASHPTEPAESAGRLGDIHDYFRIRAPRLCCAQWDARRQNELALGLLNGKHRHVQSKGIS